MALLPFTLSPLPTITILPRFDLQFYIIRATSLTLDNPSPFHGPSILIQSPDPAVLLLANISTTIAILALFSYRRLATSVTAIFRIWKRSKTGLLERTKGETAAEFS